MSIPGLQINTKSSLKTPRAISGFLMVDHQDHAGTVVLQAVADGDERAAAELLSLVCEELRSLARRKAVCNWRRPATRVDFRQPGISAGAQSTIGARPSRSSAMPGGDNSPLDSAIRSCSYEPSA